MIFLMILPIAKVCSEQKPFWGLKGQNKINSLYHQSTVTCLPSTSRQLPLWGMFPILNQEQRRNMRADVWRAHLSVRRKTEAGAQEICASSRRRVQAYRLSTSRGEGGLSRESIANSERWIAESCGQIERPRSWIDRKRDTRPETHTEAPRTIWPDWEHENGKRSAWITTNETPPARKRQSVITARVSA